MIGIRQPHQKFILILLVALLLALMLLPLQGLGACLMHAIDHHPQPLPEMCDSVLLNCGCVSISVVVSFDMALIGVWLGVIGLIALIWQVWLGATLDVRMFNPSPDPPPPRTIPF